MAASTITPAQVELINSLSQDEIPIKLRYAICSRLAVNAFRLPCCDQAICESCQSTLPATCPVCEHTPVAAADCKPNKSLRTTIKVFLRTEEKKREAVRLKEEKNTPPDTPVIVETTPIAPVEPVTPSGEPPITSNESKGAVDGDDVSQGPVAEEKPDETQPDVQPDLQQTEQAQQDIPQPSIEEIAPGQEPTADMDANSTVEAAGKNGEGSTEKDAAGQPVVPQTPGFGGFGFDPSSAGAFPGMGFGGEMNQMQMMLAMQNGMGAGGFGNFPMMGMPGMPMDPMAMQNMFMSGGFGTGMNGMGMNMGFGGVGADFNNGWNAQQSWNLGNNFNPNPASMGHGDYGNNSGYASHSAGFNQGNYGRGNHYNDYQNSYGSQGFRGRGRGRGGYARGGHSYGSNEAFSHQAPQQYGSNQQANGPISESGSIPKGPKAESESAANVDEFGRELRPETNEDTPQVVADETTAELQETKATENPEADINTDAAPQEPAETVQESSAPMPIQTLDEVENGYSADNYGSSGYGQGHYRGGRGGSFSTMQPPVKPVDVPINAPTGPKAMRAGLPNTSIYNMRGRGHIPGGISSRHEPSGSASASVAPDVSEKGDNERERSKSPSRDRDRNRDRSKDRSRSRSPNRKRSRSRDRHSRRHRYRSASPTEDDKETERRRERRREKDKERERRHRHDDDDIVDDGPGEKVTEKEDVPDRERSRSASPSGSRRSDHKSRRDKDKYRERDRDSDRDRKSSHRHRSHRHRDERERSRSRDRDRESSRRHSRRHSEEPQPEPQPPQSVVIQPAPTQEEPLRKPSIIEIKGASARRKATPEEVKTELKIPTGPRSDRVSAMARDFRKEKRPREERSSRHDSSRSGRDKDRERDRGYDREKFREKPKEKEKDRPVPTPTAPAKNPHELEREARNRERLLKEAQRMAGLNGGGGRKRDRDDGDEALSGKSRRKKGRRGGVMDESEEARIARLEAEREGNRWN